MGQKEHPGRPNEGTCGHEQTRQRCTMILDKMGQFPPTRSCGSESVSRQYIKLVPKTFPKFTLALTHWASFKIVRGENHCQASISAPSDKAF